MLEPTKELAQQLNEPKAEVLATYYTAISFISLGEFEEAGHQASSSVTPPPVHASNVRAMWTNPGLHFISPVVGCYHN